MWFLRGNDAFYVKAVQNVSQHVQYLNNIFGKLNSLLTASLEVFRRYVTQILYEVHTINIAHVLSLNAAGFVGKEFIRSNKHVSTMASTLILNNT